MRDYIVLYPNKKHQCKFLHGLLLSQKKVIQVAKSSAPVSSPVSQKVTVVKSADGRVIVKTSENLEKEPLTKVVNTVTSQPTAKTVIVSTTKASVPLAKEVEEKKDLSPTKKEESSPPVKTPTKESKKVGLWMFLQSGSQLESCHFLFLSRNSCHPTSFISLMLGNVAMNAWLCRFFFLSLSNRWHHKQGSVSQSESRILFSHAIHLGMDCFCLKVCFTSYHKC